MHKKEQRTLAYPSHVFQPEDWLRFVHGMAFEKKWTKIGLSDDDLRSLEIAIMLGPKQYPVMEATNGLRKIRFAGHEANQGKSGANRVCYVFFEDFSIVLLATVFAKGEQDNLTAAGKEVISDFIRKIERQLRDGTIT